jgi:hypothetical protein
VVYTRPFSIVTFFLLQTHFFLLLNHGFLVLHSCKVSNIILSLSLSYNYLLFSFLCYFDCLLVICVRIDSVPLKCPCQGTLYVQLYMHTPVSLAEAFEIILVLNITLQLFPSFCLLFLVVDYMRLCEILSPFP